MQKIAIQSSQELFSSVELDEALNQVLVVLRDYFQLQNSAIMLLDRRTQELKVRAQFGRPKEASELVVGFGTGLTGTAVKEKRTIYVPDVTKDPRYICSIASTRSELAIPLMVRDEVLGVLDCQSHKEDFFDQPTIDLLTLFSTQASIALENARLYLLEQRRSSQLEAINAIARETTAVVDLDELLEKVCRLILEWFRVDHVCVLLFQDGRLHLRAHEGRLTPRVVKGELLPAEGLAARALATARTVLENNVRQAPHYVEGFAETQSEMCVPLIYFGEKLGVLALESERLGAFEPDDVQPLESVADICAAAIQNAYHFERARQLAYIDGLTGIFNRRYFESRISEELARASRYQTALAVVMLDIDHFKRLNDEFGHLLGDEVLRQVSAIFTQQLRKPDILCRYGGEEFVILIPETGEQGAVEVAEKLRRVVASWHFPGVPRPVTISGGVAEFPQHGATRDELVAAADAALYAAKQSGRNRVLSAEMMKKTGAQE